ncbi:MAG: hypothetical protein ACKVX7_12965 [Planctomycetota bacterium]
MSIIEITLPANKFDPYFRKSKRDIAPRDAHVAEPKITQIRPRQATDAIAPKPPIVVLEPAAAPASTEQPRATVTSAFASPRAAKSSAPAPAARDLIIVYEGRYLGRYRSSRRINHRTAYRAIARELSVRMGDEFDPRKVSLFKLVPIEIDNALELAIGVAPDTVEWFPA